LLFLASHNQGDPSPRLTQEMLLAPALAAACNWSIFTFANTFPTLQVPPAAQPGGNNNANIDVDVPLAQLLPQALNNNCRETQEEKKDEELTIPLMGMSKRELESTLQICGLSPTAGPTLLPVWFQQCAEKGMTVAVPCLVQVQIQICNLCI
jgi:hypothetical protein